MFSYACPSCAQKLLAQPDRAGQRTVCPKCLKPLTIPTPSVADAGDDPHDGLLHAGPLVDSDAPTNPTRGPSNGHTPAPRRAPAPTTDSGDDDLADRAAAVFDPYPTPPAVAAPPPPPPPTPPPRPVPPPRPARPTRVAAAVAAPPPRPAARSAPLALRSAGADLAAELSAALTLRMKPPPEPDPELMLTTLAGVGLAVLALVLWVAGILYDPTTLPFVALIGVLLISVGYLWGAYTARGLGKLLLTLAAAAAVAAGLVWVIQRQVNAAWADLPSNLLPALALPGVSVLCALPLGVTRFRPLRFILAGEVLVLLFVVSPAARSAVQKGFDYLQPVPPAVPAPVSPAERVRGLAERKSADALLAELAELADPGRVKKADPTDRLELPTELARLCDPATEPRAEVRAAALAALAAWKPEATRPAVLAAVKSTDPGERRLGLQLAGRWADTEMAAAVAARLSDRQEWADAQKALKAMGGSAAEGAVLPLIRTEERGDTLLLLMELLEAVGGPKGLAALRLVEQTHPAASVRGEAKARADGLQARLRK